MFLIAYWSQQLMMFQAFFFFVGTSLIFWLLINSVLKFASHFWCLPKDINYVFYILLMFSIQFCCLDLCFQVKGKRDKITFTTKFWEMKEIYHFNSYWTCTQMNWWMAGGYCSYLRRMFTLETWNKMFCRLFKLEYTEKCHLHHCITWVFFSEQI